MPRPKNLARQPVKSLMAVLLPLLKKKKEADLLDHVHCSMAEGRILSVNCYNEDVLAKMRAYQPAVTDELLKAMEVSKVLFRCQPYYAVMKVIAEFEKAGIIEFTLDQVLQGLAVLGEYSVESIKGILHKLTIDVEAQPSHLHEIPAWLVPLRKEAPLVIKTGVKEFKLFRKPKPEPVPEPAKKSSKKAKR